MVMDIGFGTTSVVHHAGRRCDASCSSLGQVCDCCDAVRTCAKLFGPRPPFLVRLPMMTDTLTRTTVGDESRYSYCLRSQLLVFFPTSAARRLVMWCVGLLVVKICRSSFYLGTGCAIVRWTGGRLRQVDVTGVCASLLWNDGVAGLKERHVRHFMCTVFDSLWSMVVHVPYMLGFKRSGGVCVPCVSDKDWCGAVAGVWELFTAPE